MVKIVPELCEIDQLYHLLYFGIKNAPVFVSRDHKSPQELTTQIFYRLDKPRRLTIHLSVLN